MRVSLNWLNEYVTSGLPPEKLAHELTMVGLEVESIERQGEKFEGFVVGEVVDVAKHPNADKLSVCRVALGNETLQVVCGAPNVRAGQKVAVGVSGAVVPRNQHDPTGKPFVLSHVKVRGEDSYGMICSAYELGLGDDRDGILVFDPAAKVGTPLASYFGLNDVMMEVGITPNRPDAMSHIGVAREISAIVSRKMRLPTPSLKESTRPIKKFLSVRVENAEDCPRYSARVIMGVRLGDSPGWLKERLTAVGLRPINAIVDVTNYVLMEVGHPLHAFDYDAIQGHEIVVRSSGAAARFATLDGKERTLRPDTLMICDPEKPLAIGGIMGGTNSEISDRTQNIVIESAYFRPQGIRRSSKHLGLSTDASQRFERGADPNGTIWALDRAAALIQQIAGGEVLRGTLDVYPRKIKPKVITLRIEKVNEILGLSLDKKEVTSLLRKIDLISSASRSGSQPRNALQVSVPTFRPDIEREIDLIEEVARLHGYNNIETSVKSFSGAERPAASVRSLELVRKWLLGSGYNEVVANSMSEVSVARLASDRVVEIANPISKEMGALRTSLIPGMLSIIGSNIAHGNKDLRLYEFGKSYLLADANSRGEYLPGYIEREELLLAFSGAALPHAWDAKRREIDLFDVRGELETLFQKIFLDKIHFIPYSNGNTLTQAGLAIEIQGESAGLLGAVRKEIRERFDVGNEVLVALLDLNVLRKHLPTERRYVPLARYPSVHRDVAFVVDQSHAVGSIEACIREGVRQLELTVELFDVYIGDQIPAGKKS